MPHMNIHKYIQIISTYLVYNFNTPYKHMAFMYIGTDRQIDRQTLLHMVNTYRYISYNRWIQLSKKFLSYFFILFKRPEKVLAPKTEQSITLL